MDNDSKDIIGKYNQQQAIETPDFYLLKELANASSKNARSKIEASIKKKKVERFALTIKEGQHQQTLHKYNEICGDLR